jgi:hypothetical protein
MTATLPEGRYPRSTHRSIGRGVKLGVLALAILIGLGVAYVAYQRFSVKDVEGTALAFDLLDDRTVSIRFSVTRAHPDQEAVCIVRARSRDGSETGRREVLIPGSADREVEVVSEVKTSQPPAVGDVYGCSLNVPQYLRGS